MDYTKYIQSINDDVNNQNNQKLLSSNPNYHIEKHISHFNYDDKTKTNVLSKLKSIIDSTTAMKVFNYLVSNNLINVFLESYDYLTTLRIYNPLTYTQIINYVIDYKKTNTEMDDILEEEINFLLDTRVTKKSLQGLRNRTNNQNSVRILNKVIKNIPDKQSVKNMSAAKKEILIETLEQLPTQDDFESKADEEEQIQDVANADANINDFEEEFNDIEQEALRLGVTPEKNKSNEEDEVIDLPDLPDLDMGEEETEETDEEYRKRIRSIRLKEPFLGLSYERRQELNEYVETMEKQQENKKRKLEEDERIRQNEEEQIEIEIKKKGGRTKGVPNRPKEVIAAEKAEKAKRAEEREKLKKPKV